MQPATQDDFDLAVRHQVYRFFAEECRAPGWEEAAGRLGVEAQAVRLAYRRLHARHMLFLEPGTELIRMANPFSAVETGFSVKSGEREWWANCAWDMLGIGAALGEDISIRADYTGGGAAELALRGRRLAGVEQQVVYFPLPCSRWYDDLVFT